MLLLTINLLMNGNNYATALVTGIKYMWQRSV